MSSSMAILVAGRTPDRLATLCTLHLRINACVNESARCSRQLQGLPLMQGVAISLASD